MLLYVIIDAYGGPESLMHRSIGKQTQIEKMSSVIR